MCPKNPDDPLCAHMHRQINNISVSLQTLADRMPPQESWEDMRQDMRQVKEAIYGNGKRGLVTRVANLEVVAKIKGEKKDQVPPPPVSRESEVALEAQKAKTELFKIAIGKASGLVLKLGVIYLCFRFGYIDLVKPWLIPATPAPPVQQAPPDAATPSASATSVKN